MTPAPKKQPKAQQDPEVALLFKGEGPRVLHVGPEYRFTPGETTTLPRELAERLAAEDPDHYEVA